ncbi:MAG: hypothetical protein COV75_05575 [Candidatus Omnitrophica bacterium CG11_big_fil_rev_8_21_14_0_20_63_9]|nr:MAG: hypothetical protein COV75_05575 [Candidatus Omnitrophica bacterium CG11_big_fil_rev_8_21_14_0_20_63_9]
MRSEHPVIVRKVLAVFRALARGFFRLDVRGLEHIPAHGGALIAGNHPSVLDGILLLLLVERPVRFLVAEDMYNHHFLRPLFRLMGAIPVYRTRESNGDALRAAVEALEGGQVIGIFPESTTAYEGTLPQVRRGVALLALKTGVPVVPLSIRGTAESFPSGAAAPAPGVVRFQFYAPIRYVRMAVDPIPEPVVSTALTDIHGELLQRLAETPRVIKGEATAWSGMKRAQAALCGVIVVPLARMLTATANPSLDPVRLRAALGRLS